MSNCSQLITEAFRCERQPQALQTYSFFEFFKIMDSNSTSSISPLSQKRDKELGVCQLVFYSKYYIGGNYIKTFVLILQSEIMITNYLSNFKIVCLFVDAWILNIRVSQPKLVNFVLKYVGMPMKASLISENKVADIGYQL